MKNLMDIKVKTKGMKKGQNCSVHKRCIRKAPQRFGQRRHQCCVQKRKNPPLNDFQWKVQKK